MGTIIKDEPCPKYRENGRDRTGNHLMVFSDNGKYCNRCGYTVKPDGQVTEEYEDNMKWNEYTVADVLKLPVGLDPARKVGADTANHFRTRVEYNTTNGEVDKIFYPYIKNGKAVGYKVRKHYEENDPEVQKIRPACQYCFCGKAGRPAAQWFAPSDCPLRRVRGTIYSEGCTGQLIREELAPMMALLATVHRGGRPRLR